MPSSRCPSDVSAPCPSLVVVVAMVPPLSSSPRSLARDQLRQGEAGDESPADRQRNRVVLSKLLGLLGGCARRLRRGFLGFALDAAHLRLGLLFDVGLLG